MLKVPGVQTEVHCSISVTELLLLNCIVCGLELTSSAALTYLPPMLLEAGFSEQQMSWILGLGPCVCLIIVPIMGRWMDVCTSKYGRRIPFMLGTSLMVLASLVLIPYADHGISSAAINSHSYHAHIWMLAFTVVLVDFATQAGLTPCEVFLQDVTKGLPLRDRAFSLYSLMCSIGSCAGYLILAINWEATWIGTLFGDQEYCVFSILFVVLSILIILNLRTAASVRNRQKNIAMKSNSYVELQNLTSASPSPLEPRVLTPLKKQSFATTCKKVATCMVPEGLLHLLSVPYTLKRLILANFFAWAGVMCFLLFYSDFVGEIIYLGKPSAVAGSLQRNLYDDGVRMGSLGLFLHSAISSIVAPMMENFELWFGMKTIHLFSLAMFTISLLLMLTTKNLILLNVLTMATGVAFASMTTIPFSLVGLYHESKEIYYADLPQTQYRGLGVDMASLDTAYFSSQVLLLVFMGYIVQVTGSATAYIITAAVLSGISCYFIATCIYSEKDLRQHLDQSPTQIPLLQ